MVPLHIEQQPQLRPVANFRVTMSLYTLISQYAVMVGYVVAIVVAFVVFLQPPPTPNPSLFDFDISMDEVRMQKLEAHHSDLKNLTVEYNFFVRISVSQVGRKFKFEFFNTSVEVLIGDGEWEIQTLKSPIPPLDIESTPTSEIWTFRLYGTIFDDLDMRRVQHLANLIWGNEAILITIVLSGKDFQFRDFKASCTAHIHPFPYKPPAIHACDLVISA